MIWPNTVFLMAFTFGVGRQIMKRELDEFVLIGRFLLLAILYFGNFFAPIGLSIASASGH